MAVLMPFVMLPALVALVVTAVVLGPRNLLSLVRLRNPKDANRNEP